MKKKYIETISKIIVYSVVLLILSLFAYLFLMSKNYSFLILVMLPILYFIFKIIYIFRIIKIDMDKKLSNVFFGFGDIYLAIITIIFLLDEMYTLANFSVALIIIALIVKIIKAPNANLTNSEIKEMNYFERKKYNEYVRYAYKMVDLSHELYEKGSKLSYMYILFGMGNANVPSPNNENHDYKLVIDAIHIYYENNPERGVLEAYQDNLCTIAGACAAKTGFEHTFNFLQYEICKHKNQTNTFDLDYEKILLRLEDSLLYIKESINKNEDKYGEMKEELENGFEKWYYKEKEKIENAIASLKQVNKKSPI